MDKAHAVLIDILSEFAICDLTQVASFDKARWGRKVFKIYKTLRQAESKLASSEILLSKKLLKLVIVLYNL